MSAEEMRGTPFEETSPGPERWSDVAEVCEFGLLFYVGDAGTLR